MKERTELPRRSRVSEAEFGQQESGGLLHAASRGRNTHEASKLVARGDLMDSDPIIIDSNLTVVPAVVIAAAVLLLPWCDGGDWGGGMSL